MTDTIESLRAELDEARAALNEALARLPSTWGPPEVLRHLLEKAGRCDQAEIRAEHAEARLEKVSREARSSLPDSVAAFAIARVATCRDGEITTLRARLAEVERERDEALATMAASNANALRAQHDATDGDARWVREQARIAAERDAALAACAEMRAALEAAHYLSADWRAKVATALAHSDLERGMVAVPREVVERMCGLLRRSRVGGASRLLAALLDALLKKGGG